MGRFRALGGILLAAAGVFADVPADKKCTEAAGETMSKLRAGDSSATNLLKLSQALECMGRVEDALGATYFATQTDTVGRTDLLIYRAYLFRSLGMEDQAAKVEGELGIGRTDSGHRWQLESKPSASISIGWADQIFSPMRASLAAQYESWSLGYASADEPVDLGRMDSVVLEGDQIPVAMSLAFFAFSENAFAMFGVGWDVGMTSKFDEWRSQSATVSLLLDRELNPRFSTSISVNFGRTWYATTSGPLLTQEDGTGAMTLFVRTVPGVFSLTNTVRTSRQDSNWTWSGGHSVGWERSWWGLLKPSVNGFFGWGKDPMASDVRVIPAKVVRADGIFPGILVNRVAILDTLDQQLGELKQAKLDMDKPPVLVARETGIEYPFSMNHDWVKIGGGGGLSFGPWKAATLRLGFSYSRTIYLEVQRGANLSLDLIQQDSLYSIIYQDPASGELYASSASKDVPLVPVSWSRKRHDDNWTYSASLAWKASKWLSFQGTWTSSRTESSLEDLVDGSSSTMETISLGSSLSW